MDPNSPWFTPGSQYGASQNWDTTPFVNQYIDPQVPRGVFQSYLSQNGLGGTNRQSQFAQGQYSNTQTGWQAATRANPNLTYLDYLNQQFGGNGMRNMWLNANPDQRGESPSRWTSPTRVISWG
jgi:hypothetical protein